MLPNTLRSREVAHLLDCSPDDAAELARAGKIKARKLGPKVWTFDRQDVMRLRRSMLKRLARERA